MNGLPDAPWRRIHIIGAAGSGKTTLAHHFAMRLAIPTYDLDSVAYENGAGVKRPLGTRQAEVHAITEQSQWITEGGYIGWTEPLVAAADVVIWLDLSWHIAVWRIVLRHLRASLAGTNKHRGIRKLLRFVWRTRRYYTAAPVPTTPEDDSAMSRAATATMLQPYMSKVIRCRRPSAVKGLLRPFESSEAQQRRL